MSPLAKGLAIVLLLLALILGVLAVRLLMAASPAAAPAPVTAAQPAVEDAVPTAPVLTPVVVAARDIAAGERLDDAMLSLAAWPVAPAQGYTDVALLRNEVARVPFQAGEAVTQAGLVRGLARLLKPGERALVLPQDEATMRAARIVPGDFVDVFVVPERTPGGRAVLAPHLLLSRVRVLAFGQAGLEGVPAGQGPAAVLAVPADAVDQVLDGLRHGRAQLALRSPDDHHAETVTEPPWWQLPEPAVAPPRDTTAVRSVRQVEIIRGGRREVVQY